MSISLKKLNAIKKNVQDRFGDTYRRTRDAACATRRRVASSRRSRTRRAESQLRASERAGPMDGVWRHFDSVDHAPSVRP